MSESEGTLVELLAAWERRIEADAEFRHFLRQARAGGVSVRRLEALLGISRMTLWRWAGAVEDSA